MQETDPEIVEYDPEPERPLRKNLRAKKKREAMTAEPRRTMEDYCKRSDTEQISHGFQPADPINFDINGNVLEGLRENQFGGRANRDPWDHLTSTTKEWLQWLPRGTIETWKELEDKFLERFFTHNQFQKRKADIMNFKQRDNETLGEAYERFNLLKRKFPNHSLDLMKLMQIFIGGMHIQHRMHLDTSV
ncbi:hypothetical protein L195_g025796 [Trifolium pratense]|uniref:Retrotransposon gag domain-containing protein n=1 Tax=Trifolium pratense TaxID=57577 RepID=A0A2K3NHG1_TRIPR|nr:hypothetical protein L195_g025796 [Trifolium pratense]